MVLKVISSVIVSAVIFPVFTNCIEGSEVRIISPIGAVSRSVIPGWGQVYTHNALKGVVIFLSVGILGGGGIRADSIYRDFYNNKYRPSVLADSSQSDFYFDRSNQYYKLSRFLLYTAAGVWAYSAIDAYVDAHIYNALQQAEGLHIDDSKLQQLKTDSKAEIYREGFSQFLLTDTSKKSSLSLYPEKIFLSALTINYQGYGEFSHFPSKLQTFHKR